MSDCGICGERQHEKGCEYCAHGNGVCGNCCTPLYLSPDPRISTLEADLAQAWKKFDEERVRRVALEARIAELERVRDDQSEVIRQQEAECMRRVARNATLASDHREAEARIAELERERVSESVRWLADLDAARHDRDEAVRLLRRAKPVLDAVASLSDNTSPDGMTATDIAAFLALHPAQPETPTKGPR